MTNETIKDLLAVYADVFRCAREINEYRAKHLDYDDDYGFSEIVLNLLDDCKSLSKIIREGGGGEEEQ